MWSNLFALSSHLTNFSQSIHYQIWEIQQEVNIYLFYHPYDPDSNNKKMLLRKQRKHSPKFLWWPQINYNGNHYWVSSLDDGNDKKARNKYMDCQAKYNMTFVLINTEELFWSNPSKY